MEIKGENITEVELNIKKVLNFLINISVHKNSMIKSMSEYVCSSSDSRKPRASIFKRNNSKI